MIKKLHGKKTTWWGEWEETTWWGLRDEGTILRELHDERTDCKKTIWWRDCMMSGINGKGTISYGK